MHESGALAALAMANSRLLLPKITWFTSENGKFTWLFDCRMKSSYISYFPVALCGGVVQLRQLAPPGPKSWEYEIWIMVLVRKNARHRTAGTVFCSAERTCFAFFFRRMCERERVDVSENSTFLHPNGNFGQVRLKTHKSRTFRHSHVRKKGHEIVRPNYSLLEMGCPNY